MHVDEYSLTTLQRQKMTDPENNTMASPLESGRADSLGERTSKVCPMCLSSIQY